MLKVGLAEAAAIAYRRGIDDACAILDREYERRRQDKSQHDRYTEGATDALDEAESAIRALAPLGSSE